MRAVFYFRPGVDRDEYHTRLWPDAERGPMNVLGMTWDTPGSDAMPFRVGEQLRYFSFWLGADA